MKVISAETFLSAIWPSQLLRNETLELRARRQEDGKIEQKFLRSIKEFLRAAKSYGEGWDIYFGISTRFLQGGKKSDCFRTCCVWVDLDKTPKLPDFGEIPPDFVVSSGGGFHVYWMLESPVYVRDNRWKQIEAVNRGLTKKFNGDIMCPDISRILRVPDTFNFKYNPPKKVIANAVLNTKVS